MRTEERDQLVERLRDLQAHVMTLEDVTTHFAMGAFYAIGEATRIVQQTALANPTCLIQCRHDLKEE